VLDNQRDVYALLAGSGVSTLILRGQDDNIRTAAQFDELRRALPRAVVHDIAGLVHPLMLTHPELVAPLITALLDGAGNASASDR